MSAHHLFNLHLLLRLILVSGLTILSLGNAMAEEKVSKMSLSARGVVSAEPDFMTINTGVQTDAKQAREALSANNKAVAAMRDALKSAGLDGKDMQTSNFSVQPRYRHFKDGRSPQIIGYQVSNSVHIRIRDLTKSGDLLDRLVSLGVNNIHGISFGVQDTAKLKDEARRKAMQKVIAKAKLYADEAGVKLGKILSISESHRVDAPVPVRGMARSMAAESVPIEGGETSISAQVSVEWMIE